jgi:hypothetical protein
MIVKIVYQNLWDTAKAVARGKFMTMRAYTRKSEKFQIMMHTKFLRKQEQGSQD